MESISLEETLGCRPQETYLGRGYLEDRCRFSDILFSLSKKPSLTANLHFDHSSLAESSQGFHFSAMNVQFLVPYLCRQLLTAILAQDAQELSFFQLWKSKQKYSQHIGEKEGIRCQVQLEAIEEQTLSSQKSYIFSYAIITTSAQDAAFSGTMAFVVSSVPGTLSYHAPLSLENITVSDCYALRDIRYEERQQHIAAQLSFSNGTAPSALSLVHVHGALAQLTRSLFCKLFALDRARVIQAQAYRAEHHYHLESPSPTEEVSFSVAADKQIHVKKYGNTELALVFCSYTAGSPLQAYATGSLHVACPVPVLTPQQQSLLEAFRTN